MGNSGEEAEDRTRSRSILPVNFARVNDVAKRSRQTRFTALLHHVDVEALERAFRRLRRKAAPGVDGTTVDAYAGDLEANLHDLCDRLHGGRYRPLPVRRTYIPKADGGQRPLGILALDAAGLASRAVVMIFDALSVDISASSTERPCGPARNQTRRLRIERRGAGAGLASSLAGDSD